MRRVPRLRKDILKRLSEAGAFNSFDGTAHRREALWQSALAVRPVTAPEDFLDQWNDDHQAGKPQSDHGGMPRGPILKQGRIKAFEARGKSENRKVRLPRVAVDA